MNKSIFTKVFTNAAPPPIGPYSQAVLSNGILYCSGQIPIDPQTGALAGSETLAEPDITAQTKQVCENIAAVLSAAGLNFGNVVKTTCFLTSMSDFSAFNDVYEKYFISKPARSCVAVKELPKGALVEVEVTAAI